MIRQEKDGEEHHHSILEKSKEVTISLSLFISHMLPLRTGGFHAQSLLQYDCPNFHLPHNCIAD